MKISLCQINLKIGDLDYNIKHKGTVTLIRWVMDKKKALIKRASYLWNEINYLLSISALFIPSLYPHLYPSQLEFPIHVGILGTGSLLLKVHPLT